jgi:hypothetical protein
VSGTVTIVAAEGRRVMRLSRELTPEVFGALLEDYQRRLGGLLLLDRLLERAPCGRPVAGFQSLLSRAEKSIRVDRHENI